MSDTDFNYNFCSYDPRHPDYGMIKEIAIFHDLPEPKVEKDCSCDSCFNGSHKLACTIESLQASLKAAEAKLAEAISGLRYIHDAYGRFSGVEWDRMGIEGTDHE